MFDFDCPDFSLYEHEKYQFVEFKYPELFSSNIEPTSATVCDRVILRDRTNINVQCIESSSLNPSTEFKYSDQEMVLRMMYKPSSGTLWAFNRPQLNQQNFMELPNPDGIGTRPNEIDESKHQKELEEDEENDVELKHTMWLIIRKKRSVNNVLKDFFPDYQQQVIRVRDIIKFGRVNFKISALYCDRIDKMYTGHCYKPPEERQV